MNSSQRIALNTAATYARSIVSAALALFSSRWVLNSLGLMNFGLYSLVGSVIIMVVFMNNIMAGSVARFFAFSIGQGDSDEVNRWFNAAFSIHLCLGAVLTLIGWPIGEYVIVHLLTVPADRLSACLWVFRISLVSAFFSMISVPFVAMFTAKQHITELAVWGVLQSSLTFSLAWLLRRALGDRLLFYSVGMASIIVLVQSIQIFRALDIFHECKFVLKQWFDRKKIRDIFSFATWNIIGSLGMVGRDQGSALLLNVYFGPGLNAAYGIANQVSVQVNQLSAAMVGAFSPEITASEGRGDRSRMLFLSMRASKFGTILVLLLAIPLLTEMDYILKLWLHEPPPLAALFCRWILGTFLIDRLSTGYMLAVNACGKIAAYQMSIGISLLLTLPLAWFFLKIGFAPTSIGIAFVITMCVCSIGRIIWGKVLFGVALRRWFFTVVMPCAIVALAASFAAWALRSCSPPSFLRFVFTFSGSVAVSLLTAWFFALDNMEREFAKRSMRHTWDSLKILD